LEKVSVVPTTVMCCDARVMSTTENVFEPLRKHPVASAALSMIRNPNPAPLTRPAARAAGRSHPAVSEVRPTTPASPTSGASVFACVKVGDSSTTWPARVARERSCAASRWDLGSIRNSVEPGESRRADFVPEKVTGTETSTPWLRSTSAIALLPAGAGLVAENGTPPVDAPVVARPITAISTRKTAATTQNSALRLAVRIVGVRVVPAVVMGS
jgi:hypothetical protein